MADSFLIQYTLGCRTTEVVNPHIDDYEGARINTVTLTSKQQEENYPLTESTTPEDFENDPDPQHRKMVHSTTKKPCRRLFTISQLSLLELPPSAGSTTGYLP